jgi:hypothetical protein
MSAFRKTLAIAPLALLLATIQGVAFSGNERVEVPIRQIKISDGVIRYSVPISVSGGAPIDAELDTGSFGLRVLERAMTPSQYSSTGIHRQIAFGSGARLSGVIATAVVGVGEAMTPSPIPFQVVQAVDCVETKPKCPASKVKFEDYGIAGDGFPHEGFDAILGISMRFPLAPMGAINPLAAIGSRSWIVILPRPGDDAPGQLIINPNESDTAGFKLYQMEHQPNPRGSTEEIGWQDTKIPVCPDPSKQGCPATRFDSGGGSTELMSPFWSYAMLFDQNKGVIGLKPRQ